MFCIMHTVLKQKQKTTTQTNLDLVVELWMYLEALFKSTPVFVLCKSYLFYIYIEETSLCIHNNNYLLVAHKPYA